MDTSTRRDAEAARQGEKMKRGGVFFGERIRGKKTYLTLAIVPPRPLVTQTNKTARTYHRGAVSDCGLDTAVFFKLDQVVQRVPGPCAAETGRIIIYVTQS